VIGRTYLQRPLRAIAWGALVAILAAAAPEAHASPPRPRVRVIATGGTIANAPTRRLTAEELIGTLPHPERLARLETETLTNLPSAALTLSECIRLSRRVIEVFAADRDLDGIVITMGTDTMEEIAWFLHLTVSADRPVVLVGAMRRAGAPDADGPRNLADAVFVAGHSGARRRGVLVVMHGLISSARDVRKRHATDITAFDPPPHERVGTVQGGRVRFAGAGRPIRLAGSLPLATDQPLPRVELLLTYQGASGNAIDAAATSGVRGVVIAAAGAGALTPSQGEAIRRAAQAGIPVLIASRTGAGSVMLPDDFHDLPVLGARDLAPVKARLLLMLALARGLTAQQLAGLVSEL
jgi:L-asparaginase